MPSMQQNHSGPPKKWLLSHISGRCTPLYLWLAEGRSEFHRSPFTARRSRDFKGTPEDLVNCSAHSRLLRSSNIHDHCGLRLSPTPIVHSPTCIHPTSRL